MRASGITRTVSQRLHLTGGGFGQFATPMSRDDVPEARKAVDKTPPVGIEQIGAFPAHPDVRGRFVESPIVQRVDKVCEILPE